MFLELICSRAENIDHSVVETTVRLACGPSEFSDPRETELHRHYRSCDLERQSRLLVTGRDFAGRSQGYSNSFLSAAKG